jgi:UDP-N-acetylmuramyl tripeptide synthase
VPVQVLTEGAAAAPGRIEIVLNGGKRVRVEPGFDPQALEDVLAVLEHQPC